MVITTNSAGSSGAKPIVTFTIPCSMSVWLVVLVDERLNEGDESGEENRREHYFPLARSAASPAA